jgi:hypothetical protein
VTGLQSASFSGAWCLQSHVIPRHQCYILGISPWWYLQATKRLCAWRMFVCGVEVPIDTKHIHPGGFFLIFSVLEILEST